MFDFENMLAISFEERLRPMDQADLERFEEAMAVASRAFAKLPFAKGEPKTLAEQRKFEMDQSERYMNRPAVQAIITYLKSSDSISGGYWNDYAYFLRENQDVATQLLKEVQDQENWDFFTIADDGFTRERVFINFNHASGAIETEMVTEFITDRQEGQFERLPSAFAHLPLEDITRLLDEQGRLYSHVKNDLGRAAIIFR
ncbi:MAG: hypothetical protein AAF549_00550 [Pseudomonadota bacterium]